MNKLITTALFAVTTALIIAPAPAKADGDEAVAAVGGFIGGLIVGSSINNDRHDHGHYEDRSGVHVSTRIVIGRDHHRHHHNHGYWQWNRVRVWVPGAWVVRYDDCGRRHRHFERGHYEYRRERVWVGTGRHGRCDVCR